MHITTELIVTWAVGLSAVCGGLFSVIRFIRKPLREKIDSLGATIADLRESLGEEEVRARKVDKEHYDMMDGIRKELAFLQGKLNGKPK